MDDVKRVVAELVTNTVTVIDSLTIVRKHDNLKKVVMRHDDTAKTKTGSRNTMSGTHLKMKLNDGTLLEFTLTLRAKEDKTSFIKADDDIQGPSLGYTS